MKTAFLAITAVSLLAASAVSAQTAPAAKPVATAAKSAAAPVAAPAPVKPASMPATPPAPPAPVYRAPPAPVYRAPAPAPVDTTESLVRKIISQHRATIATAEALESMSQDKLAQRIARSTRYRAERDIVTLETWLRQNGKSAN